VLGGLADMKRGFHPHSLNGDGQSHVKKGAGDAPLLAAP
jgi:hypothetical protein